MFLIDFSTLDNLRQLSRWCGDSKTTPDSRMAPLEFRFIDHAVAGETEVPLSLDEINELAQVCAERAATHPDAKEWVEFFDAELAAIRVANAA